ncbi:hypothetical protein T4A_1823 [Trichinella pseudospiralis]|uniref:Uncharacterized protein n=1 Tax=Trichinella pseudospiralis TaxID=6337 RepID=A0A0V1DL81_TRIPS|nr:hypothetical protein T4D_13102 [Trichinella pseudospiralis]KRY60474.1 hypothetical protein T4D_5175 [Trichinella pseudospiralis]KRY62317.1 hypothetical protein T4A_1823 [Trichinella pseudospiralis]KRY96493.1 hypothetical protein T4C_3326 [Trichinella pseudospiralis]KRY96497.1 hypothetical protein T4C_731 [Trichinella pseudospiralis]
MPKLKKGATPSELVKGVTATHMKTIGKKTEPAETTPLHYYVTCEFS